MAQVVKLKRTAVQGRIPTISNLELGELAINTYDGRIFFEKDDGTLSIQEILTTNSQNSGSFNLSGAITASHFVGDGSGITNLPNVEVSQVTTVTSSFDNQTTITVTHNFDSKNVIVSVYDNSYQQLIPQTLTLTDNNTVDVVLSAPHSGHIVVAKGGHIISDNDLTSYRLDVSGSNSYSVSHSLDEDFPFVQCWNINTNKIEQPSDVETTSNNSLTVTFSGNFEGKIIVKK